MTPEEITELDRLYRHPDYNVPREPVLRLIADYRALDAEIASMRRVDWAVEEQKYMDEIALFRAEIAKLVELLVRVDEDCGGNHDWAISEGTWDDLRSVLASVRGDA